MRLPLFAGNWKMHGNVQESRDLANGIQRQLEDLEGRINDATLYLRFSKQKFIKKTLMLEEKDPIRISIYTPVYVKKELYSTYRKLLTIK